MAKRKGKEAALWVDLDGGDEIMEALSQLTPANWRKNVHNYRSVETGQFVKVKTTVNLRKILRKIADHLRRKLQKYPPPGPWNTPGPYPKRWYERGWGSRYARVDGSVGGKRTSEKLKSSWFRPRAGGFGRILFNTASYAGFVPGPDEQTGVHKRHGWRTTEQHMEDDWPFMEKQLNKALDRIAK